VAKILMFGRFAAKAKEERVNDKNVATIKRGILKNAFILTPKKTRDPIDRPPIIAQFETRFVRLGQSLMGGGNQESEGGRQKVIQESEGSAKSKNLLFCRFDISKKSQGNPDDFLQERRTRARQASPLRKKGSGSACPFLPNLLIPDL
jgi:hypothetical protein